MANSRLKLTQTAVTRLIREHDGKKKARHWDTEVPKMFLSITPNGSAAYKLLIVKPDGSKSDTKLIAVSVSFRLHARSARPFFAAPVKRRTVNRV